MKFILLFSAVMTLLTMPARCRGADFEVVNNVPKFEVVNKIPCACALTGTCTCWEGDCTCAACKKSVAKPATTLRGKVVENFDEDHHCNLCGKYANVVVDQENGIHAHSCNHAGTKFAGQPTLKWWHNDPPKATYTIPSSLSGGNCPNGNCANTNSRGYLIRRR